MKSVVKCLLPILFALSLSETAYPANMTPDEMVKGIKWIAVSGFQIQSGGKTVYFDPVQVDNRRNYAKADLILITHSHADHYSGADINKLTNTSTIVVASVDTAESAKAFYQTILLKPGMTTNIKGILIEAVPAYKEDHPKGSSFNGYVITIDGVRIYHTGASGNIPEMKNIQCDILIGMFYPMDDGNDIEALEKSTLDTGAKYVIPMHHYPTKISIKDADKIQKFLGKKAKIILLPMLAE
jgi:L-ascorbate metabolism protein UlaG (beta-lactamase superfamily)